MLCGACLTKSAVGSASSSDLAPISQFFIGDTDSESDVDKDGTEIVSIFDSTWTLIRWCDIPPDFEGECMLDKVEDRLLDQNILDCELDQLIAECSVSLDADVQVLAAIKSQLDAFKGLEIRAAQVDGAEPEEALALHHSGALQARYDRSKGEVANRLKKLQVLRGWRAQYCLS